MTPRALRSVRIWIPALVVIGLATPRAQMWQDVIRNLRNPDPEIRLASVQQLGSARYSPAAEMVAALLVDPDDRVQFAAIEAELAFFLIEKPTGRESVAQSAFDAGPLIRNAAAVPVPVLDKLIAAMRDENPRIRFDAVHALGAIAEAPLPPAQLTALAAELDHYDPLIRTGTCRVIGRLQAREAADKLLIALNDSQSLVRQFAVEALGQVRADSAVPYLLSLLIRDRGAAAPQALLALARIAPASALDHFRKNLASKQPALRRAAAEGLGRLKDRDSLAALQNLLKVDKSNSVRLAAAFALNELGEVQTHQIAAAMVLRDIGADARDYLLELGRASVPGIEAALKVATDERHRLDLVQLVGFVGTRDDVSVVQPFLQDKKLRVRNAADNTIARLTRK